MPALGDIGAEPLRFLDFLIHQPERAVLLHGAGVAVLVPSPERFAIHKLIVATRRITDRSGLAKSNKDRRQAELLIDAMVQTGRSAALADAYVEAFTRGPSWQAAIAESLVALAGSGPTSAKEKLAASVAKTGAEPKQYGLD
jgi:hypothetical protein